MFIQVVIKDGLSMKENVIFAVSEYLWCLYERVFGEINVRLFDFYFPGVPLFCVPH